MSPELATSLRPTGPLGTIDRAFAIVRHLGAAHVLRTWAGGGAIAFVVVTAFYVERIEGWGGLLFPAALSLVAAWWYRCVTQAHAARAAVRVLWPDAVLSPGAGTTVAVLQAGSVAGMGLWVWLWWLVLCAWGGPLVVALGFPFLCFRGLVAPAWLARAACAASSGIGGWFRSAANASGQRLLGVAVELLLLVGSLLLFGNLLGIAAFVLLLGRALLGLEVTMADAFLSFRNPFATLVFAGLALALIEPVRAAVSASLYVDARVRREGLDLRAAVDAAVQSGGGTRQGPRRGAGMGAAAMLLLALIPGVARAQEAELTTRDREVQAQVQDILSASEYQEIPDRPRDDSLLRWLKRLWDKLFPEDIDVPDAPEMALPSIPLPPAWVFLLFAGTLLLGVLVYVWVSRVRDEDAPVRAGDDAPVTGDPRDVAPEAHMDEAAMLAARGSYRAALRSLYLATLVALDRQRLISFDPALTNWQYLRQMPRGQARDDFRRFTRLFDHKWYGDEPTTEADYDLARGMAARVCGVGKVEAA